MTEGKKGKHHIQDINLTSVTFFGFSSTLCVEEEKDQEGRSGRGRVESKGFKGPVGCNEVSASVPGLEHTVGSPERGGPTAPPSLPGHLPSLASEGRGVGSSFGTLLEASQKATAALPPWEVLSGLWGVFETSLWRSASLPACLPAPPWAYLGVTVTTIIQEAVEQICAVCNLLCAHFFVLLLPLNGGKQTFWEGISLMNLQNVKHSNGK